jgi:hypothetical protein
MVMSVSCPALTREAPQHRACSKARTAPVGMRAKRVSWNKKKSKPKAKAKPKAAPPRASRRLAGKAPVRQPEPPKKKKKKANKSRAPVKSNFRAERALTGDPTYGGPLYGKGVSVLDGALSQFRQAGYDRDLRYILFVLIYFLNSSVPTNTYCSGARYRAAMPASSQWFCPF